jgi:hypothetical protein
MKALRSAEPIRGTTERLSWRDVFCPLCQSIPDSFGGLTPDDTLRKSDTTIANTILSQLGGQRFIAMTGAKFLLAHESALSFHLPSDFATNGINRVRIDLTAADLCDMTFMLAVSKCSTKRRSKTSICDQLRSIFTEATGLEVSLGSLSEDRTHSAQ